MIPAPRRPVPVITDLGPRRRRRAGLYHAAAAWWAALVTLTAGQAARGHWVLAWWQVPAMTGISSLYGAWSHHLWMTRRR